MHGETLLSFVVRSALRVRLLRAIDRDPRSTTALQADVEVSQSGIYKALDELEDRSLVAERDRWELTARGRLIADELDRQGALDALLDDESYWATHDASVVPRRFRQRLPTVEGWELYHNPDRNPQYIERWAIELFRHSDWLAVGARVYYPTFAQAVDELAERGVVDASVVVDERLVEGRVERYAGGDRSGAVDERVGSLPFSFAVTEDFFALSLPTRDGESDLDAVIVGSGRGARALGRDVFDHYWAEAAPVAEHVPTA